MDIDAQRRSNRVRPVTVPIDKALGGPAMWLYEALTRARIQGSERETRRILGVLPWVTTNSYGRRTCARPAN